MTATTTARRLVTRSRATALANAVAVFPRELGNGEWVLDLRHRDGRPIQGLAGHFSSREDANSACYAVLTALGLSWNLEAAPAGE